MSSFLRLLLYKHTREGAYLTRHGFWQNKSVALQGSFQR